MNVDTNESAQNGWFVSFCLVFAKTIFVIKYSLEEYRNVGDKEVEVNIKYMYVKFN